MPKLDKVILTQSNEDVLNTILFTPTFPTERI